MTDVETVVTLDVADADDDALHITCCDDEDVSVCGLDLTGVEWSEDGGLCAPCHEAMEFDNLADPGSDAIPCVVCPLLPREERSHGLRD